jgi:hypothetical protein
MRCVCCNRNLNDYESTLRHAETREFLDTCLKCLEGTGIPTIGRDDLSEFDNVEDDLESIQEDDDEVS